MSDNNIDKEVRKELREFYKKLAEAEVARATIIADIKNLSAKINDGLSADIVYIRDLLSNLVPTVKDNSYWVGKVKWGIFWIFIVSLCGGITSFAFYIIKNIT